MQLHAPGVAARARRAASTAPARRRGGMTITNVAVPSKPPTFRSAKRSKVEIIKEKSDYLRHPLMQVRTLACVRRRAGDHAQRAAAPRSFLSSSPHTPPTPQTLLQELVTPEPYISEEAMQLMKFHGSYMQDHREKRAFGSGKFYQFMMRTRQPSGLVTNQLYLVMDDLADQVLRLFCCLLLRCLLVFRCCCGCGCGGRRHAHDRKTHHTRTKKQNHKNSTATARCA